MMKLTTPQNMQRVYDLTAELRKAKEELENLRIQNNMLQYERNGLQTRLDRIREEKIKINLLLDTPTLEEHLAKGENTSTYPFVGRKL